MSLPGATFHSWATLRAWRRACQSAGSVGCGRSGAAGGSGVGARVGGAGFGCAGFGCARFGCARFGCARGGCSRGGCSPRGGCSGAGRCAVRRCEVDGGIGYEAGGVGSRPGSASDNCARIVGCRFSWPRSVQFFSNAGLFRTSVFRVRIHFAGKPPDGGALKDLSWALARCPSEAVAGAQARVNRFSWGSRRPRREPEKGRDTHSS